MAITITPRAVAKRAGDVLGYIRMCIRKGYGFPGADVIAGRFGWSAASVRAVLDRLVADGALVRAAGGRLALAAPRPPEPPGPMPRQGNLFP